MHNGHYVEYFFMNSIVADSMTAADLARRSHAITLHNYRFFKNSNNESGA